MSLDDRAQAMLERLWYRRRGLSFGLLAPLLGPATLVTWGLGRYRRSGSAIAPAIPVIAVGNLVVGGSGKTQVVLEFARRAVVLGVRVAIVSRGFGGTQRAPAEVCGASDAARFGDEPVLLAARLPGAIVIVARDRLRGVSLAAKLGCTLAVLDDGLQQMALRPSCRVAVFGAEAPLGNGALLPLGPLRDPPSALSVDDCVWVHGEGPASQLSRIDVRSRTEPLGLVPAAGPLADPVPLAERPLFAFAGIARPERFFATLLAAGATVVGSARFADHRRFDRLELLRLSEKGRALGAEALVCTEKDAVRLPRGELELPVLALRTRLAVIEGEPMIDELLARCAHS